MNKYLIVSIMLIGLLFAISCSEDDVTKPSKDEDVKWWVLTHRNSDPGEAGIFLYNETADYIEHSVPIPDGLDSPHALCYDGASLWVGGAGTVDSIYQLDPMDGTIVSIIENCRTEGLANSDTCLWYSTISTGPDGIVLMEKDGTAIDTVKLSTTTINDIASDGSWLYYVINDDTNKIIRVDPLTGDEAILVPAMSADPYTLAIRDDAFIVIKGDYPSRENAILRFDIESGEMISDHNICVVGWITAITPFF